MQVNILAIGAHPDDVELGAGGLLLRMGKQGYSTGIVDLTRGEMGSRGTPEIRAQEAETAAKILGAKTRRNLDLGDGRLEVNLHNRHALAKVVRQLKPTFLIGPYFDDKHPDHAAAGMLMRQASYDARMKKLDLGIAPHSVHIMFHYPCHIYINPSIVVDITPYFERKQEAVMAYKSQFSLSPENGYYPEYVHIGITNYIKHTKARCGHFGSMVGVNYGEGFFCQDPLLINDLYTLIS